MLAVSIFSYVVGMLTALVLMLWREYLYQRILKSKGDNKEVEFIFGEPYIICPENEYYENQNPLGKLS